jgi:tRNA pseudouridine55 synthase
MPIISVWKRIGETPLQATERARKEYGITDEQACFTGRLDPMAQGIQISLFGSDVSMSERFNTCRKTYRFTAILGIATSSYDPLGDITDIVDIPYDQAQRFHQKMLAIRGKMIQAFPPCSAYRYKGRPMWWHAKNGSLPKPMPAKEREIYSVKEISSPINLPVSTYRRTVIEDIKDVNYYNGDKFNGSRVIGGWRGLKKDIPVWRAQYEVTVSSGTYVRSLVHNLGVELGIPAHAMRITRLKIH